jgi:hypothetical protein
LDTAIIFTTDDYIEASQVIDFLETNGIPTMAKNMHTQNLFSSFKPFLGRDPIAGSIQVIVKEEDAERSIALLEERLPPAGEEADGDETVDAVDVVEEPDAIQERPYSETSAGKEFYQTRTLYIALTLAMTSFFVVPALLNIPFLIKLRRTRPALFAMLAALTVLTAAAGAFFWIWHFSGLSG